MSVGPPSDPWVTTSDTTSLFDGVDADGYDGIWRAWKFGSLGLFAAFVACAVDIAISMRKHAGR